MARFAGEMTRRAMYRVEGAIECVGRPFYAADPGKTVLLGTNARSVSVAEALCFWDRLFERYCRECDRAGVR